MKTYAQAKAVAPSVQSKLDHPRLSVVMQAENVISAETPAENLAGSGHGLGRIPIQAKLEGSEAHGQYKETGQMAKKTASIGFKPPAANNQRVPHQQVPAVIQRITIKKGWKEQRKRFINPARRRPHEEKKAAWLRLAESKGDLIEEAGYSIEEALRLKKHLDRLNKSHQFDDLMELAAVKGIDIDELLKMVGISVDVEKRDYPNPFESKQEFIDFKARVTALVRKWNLPTHDIRIQGSALRKTQPKDVDIAVMVDETTFQNLGRRMIAYTDKDTIRKSLEKGIKKGKIAASFFDRLPATRTFGQLLYETMPKKYKNAEGKKVLAQLSIIQSGSELDMQPYMKF